MRLRTPLQVIKLSMNILQGQPLSCSVTKAIFIPQRMTLLSVTGIFTLHRNVDVPFVKHKCSKCRTTFPIRVTSNVNMSRSHHNTQRATPLRSVRNGNIALRSGTLAADSMRCLPVTQGYLHPLN